MNKGVIKQYPLRIDEKIWRASKSKAALEGITMRELIERMLKAWVEGEINLPEKGEDDGD